MSDGPFFKEESPEGFQRIVLPMIRKIIPDVIASELVKVQPMIGDEGSIYSLRLKGEPESEQEPSLVDLINEVFK